MANVIAVVAGVMSLIITLTALWVWAIRGLSTEIAQASATTALIMAMIGWVAAMFADWS